MVEILRQGRDPNVQPTQPLACQGLAAFAGTGDPRGGRWRRAQLAPPTLQQRAHVRIPVRDGAVPGAREATRQRRVVFLLPRYARGRVHQAAQRMVEPLGAGRECVVTRVCE